jgi:hypothetical protein
MIARTAYHPHFPKTEYRINTRYCDTTIEIF